MIPTLERSHRSNRRGDQTVGPQRRGSDHIDYGRTSWSTPRVEKKVTVLRTYRLTWSGPPDYCDSSEGGRFRV